MRLSARYFLERWKGVLRPVNFPDPAPSLPQEATEFLTSFGLPAKVLIRCYNDITIDFFREAIPLATIWEADRERGFNWGSMPSEWTCYWHLGEVEYLQGGGWFCIEEVTGRLVVIDLDSSDPIYGVNASVGNFYAILGAFLDWSEEMSGEVEAISDLRDFLSQQTSVTFEELEPFWINIIDATLDQRAGMLSVTLS